MRFNQKTMVRVILVAFIMCILTPKAFANIENKQPAATPEASKRQVKAQAPTSAPDHVQQVLDNIRANPLPHLKAVHLLFYSQEVYFKIVLSVAFLLITVFLYSFKTLPFARIFIRKVSDFAVPLTLLNLGIAMLIFSVNKEISSAMPAIAIALLSSFCGYFLESCFDDLILED